jgi:hypothetical protein
MSEYERNWTLANSPLGRPSKVKSACVSTSSELGFGAAVDHG